MITPVSYRIHPAFFIFFFLSAISFASSSYAQTSPTLDEVATYRGAVSADNSLTEEARAVLLQQLDNAQLHIQAREEFEARSKAFKDVMANADQRVAQFEQKLAQAKENDGDTNQPLPDDATADQIRSQITLTNAQRQAYGERRAQLLQETDNLPARRAEIQQRLVALQKQDSATDLSTPTDALGKQIAHALALSRQSALDAERTALELEVVSEPARSRVAAAERAWTGLAIDQVETRLATLNAAMGAARSSATEEQLETTAQLQLQLQNKDPALQQFAEDNRILAEQLQSIATQSDKARLEGNRLQDALESMQQDSLLMKRRLKVSGRKEVLGRVMITQLDSLPDTEKMNRDIDRRNKLIADSSLAQIDIDEDFRAINDRQNYLIALVPDLDNMTPGSQQLVSSLIDQRTQLLERNLQSLGSLLHQLLENNERAVNLIDVTSDFHKYLLGNLLWVRDFSYLDLGVLSNQLSITFSPANWAHLPSQLQAGYLAEPWSGALLVAVVLSLLLRRQLRPVYMRLLSQPVLVSGTTLWNMVAGLALSAIIVLPWPLLLYCLGKILQSAEPTTLFSDAMVPALKVTALLVYMLLLTRLVASRQGVGRRYLKWNTRVLEALRKELNWAGPTICLAGLLDVFAFHLDVFVSGGPLGAISTTVVAASLITVGVRLLRQDIFSENRVSRLSLRMLVVVAASVIIMQLIGLLFAADIYLIGLASSIIVLGLIKLIGDVLERWLMILRARLERDTRDVYREQREVTEDALDEESLIDVISLSEAHTKLLNMARLLIITSALFVIWAPSLPALNMLDGISLWQVNDSSNPDGGMRSITLFDLALSAVILLVTGLVTKHLPSISEVFMREWFNMSAGARYATSILLQYLVIAIGGSMFLGTVGWEWGKVQWLVAALGVGIGFGLQEIVANFISGIIILFERPVRVGDIISAGGAEGTVKKINPRATIIETFDRKEHLIPNKELITGEVINWTLSDGAVRVVIPVGIAYGSDVRQAMALLLETAAEVDTVLCEPQPRASFEDFGDNALVLWLRCYVSEDRIGTWTELRTVINEKFAAAGISISFPQRDVHLDTLEPLQVEVRHLGAGNSGTSGAIPNG